MKHIKCLLFVILPAVFCYFILWFPSMLTRMKGELIVGLNGAIPVVLYLATIAYVVLFIKTRPTYISVLPISFLITPLSVFIYETSTRSWFPYVSTILCAIYYAFPFALITAIIAICMKKRERRSKMSTL